MIRLFIAIDLPETAKEELGRLCFGLPGARWIEPEQIHLTLRFIGEVDGGLFHEVRSGLEHVECPSFPLTLKGLGCFPPRGEPHVLWVGVEKSEPLFRLRKKVDVRLAGIGVAPEKRKFSPHVTLARLKETPLVRLTNFLSGNGLFALPEFTVSRFHLYSSLLTPKGAVHRLEGSYPLD